jgi:hypothetical protein
LASKTQRPQVMPERRFPPSWTADACFVVKDSEVRINSDALLS